MKNQKVKPKSQKVAAVRPAKSANRTQPNKISPQNHKPIIKPLGLVEDVSKAIDFGASVVDTVISTIENPVDGILNKLPNAVAKFADMTSGKSKTLDPTAQDNHISIKGPIYDGSKEEKFISSLKQDLPVLATTQIPSSFSTEFSPPPVRSSTVKVGSETALKLSGSVVIIPLQTNAGDTVDLKRRFSLFVNPGYTYFGDVLSNTAKMFQQCQLVSMSATYITSSSSSEMGSTILTFQNSPNTTYTPTTEVKDLSQRTHFTMGSVTKNITLPLQAVFPRRYVAFADYTSDPKFYGDWTVEGWTINTVAPTSGSKAHGFIAISYEWLFFSRIEDPTIGAAHDLRYLGFEWVKLFARCSSKSLHRALAKFSLYLEDNSEKADHIRYESCKEIRKLVFDTLQPEYGSEDERIADSLGEYLCSKRKLMIMCSAFDLDVPVITQIVRILIEQSPEIGTMMKEYRTEALYQQNNKSKTK